MNFRLLLILLIFPFFMDAQKEAPENWFNLDLVEDGVPGISTEKMYRDLLKDRQGQKVIVAVLDSGVDYKHEDLKDVMWINEDEIPGNGKDDDQNGYIDDIYGWNFLGNAEGENVAYANLEMTRLYKQYAAKFAQMDTTRLKGKDRQDFDLYQSYGKTIKRKRKKMEEEAIWVGTIVQAIQLLKQDMGKMLITSADLSDYKSDNELLQQTARIMQEWMSDGTTFNQVELNLIDNFEYYFERYEFYYNVDYDSRAIVGDDINDINDTDYGNNDVIGPDAEHGTHVAGIIAAKRFNDLGMNGVADQVEIMAVRTLCTGDETDKDVANAIRYAVDNGASVINMSFGKGLSPHKKWVDQAVKYAHKKDVLIIHAAGNEHMKNTFDNHFPNDRYRKSGLFGPKYAENWLEIGAVDWQGGERLAADFSNYGHNTVDVFAPGVDIYSTTPENNYTAHQGTSMAAPVVAGLAAVLRSYFPQLTAVQVKNIIMDSAIKQKTKVLKPGAEDKMVNFGQLSVTGAIVNAYEAVRLAEKTKGKKKVKIEAVSPESNNKPEIVTGEQNVRS